MMKNVLAYKWHYFNFAVAGMILMVALTAWSQRGNVENPQATTTKVLAIGLWAVALIIVGLFLGQPSNRLVSMSMILVLVGGQAFLPNYKPYGIEVGTTDSPNQYPVPYLMYTGRPEAKDHNILGYQGELPPMPKEDEYRVFIIGNSAVYDADFSPLLEAHLKNHYDHPQVYNWGVYGQNSTMEVATLLYRVTQYDPDLVVLYNGGVDSTGNFFADPRPGYPYNFMVYENAIQVLQKHNWIWGASLLIWSESSLWSYIFEAEWNGGFAPLDRLREEVSFTSPEWLQRVAESYVHNMELACQVASQFDFSLSVFLQPIAETQRPETEDEPNLTIDLYNQMAEGLKVLDDRYQGTSPCRFYDFSHICDGQEACEFTDGAHVTRDTDPYITEQLYLLLVEQGYFSPSISD